LSCHHLTEQKPLKAENIQKFRRKGSRREKREEGRDLFVSREKKMRIWHDLLTV